MGVDRLLAEPGRLAGRRYGLLGHAASVGADLVPIHLALLRAGVPPAALFGPEHGYHGFEQDMVASADARDPWSGLPIRSLYGDSEASLRPDPSAFAGLDLLVVDLQDVGSRYYTFVATAVWAGEAAARAGCEVWILDRPNPLGGAIEGNIREPGFDSFVGAFTTPQRHGLTLGELVVREARAGGWESAVRVIAVEGWRRSDGWPAERPWIAPSPNMPTLTTALVYPGGCLIEATTLSEGRGTTRPFQLVGDPRLDPPALADALDARDLPGVRFVPCYFRPQFQKHRGEICGGVEVVVTDAAAFRALRTGVELLAAAYAQLGEANGRRARGPAAPSGSTSDFWRADPYEFVSDRPAIDLLAGSVELRLGLDDRPRLERWMASWERDERAFGAERESFALYR